MGIRDLLGAGKAGGYTDGDSVFIGGVSASVGGTAGSRQ